MKIYTHISENNRLFKNKKDKIIDNWMSNLVNKQILPFAMTIIEKNSIPLYWRWCGFSNPEKEILPDENTLMRIYSMTKPFTALLTLILE